MNKHHETTKVGEIRPSQILYPFGIGAIADLPHFSAMVMGLDDWPVQDCPEIPEERLLGQIRTVLGEQVQALYAPPPADVPQVGALQPFVPNDRKGVPVATFPRWYVCSACRLLAPLRSELFQFKPDRYRADRSQYVHPNCPKRPGKPPRAIPARFLVACEQGHIDDFPWEYYVHHGQIGCRTRLRLTDTGATGEAVEVWVSCDTCGDARPMSGAFEATPK